jgi:hypothetical protein
VVFKEPYSSGLLVLIVTSRTTRIRNKDCNNNPLFLKQRSSDPEFADRIFVYNDITATV